MTKKEPITKKEEVAAPNGTAGPSASANQSTNPASEAKKYPYKLPGTMRVMSENLDLEFKVSQSTGESNREDIASTKGSTLYKTKGTKQQTLVAHLTARPDSNDPLADMYGQLERMAKDAKLETKVEPKLKGEKLHDSKNLSVILSKKEHKIDVRIAIDLAEHPDYKDEFYKAIVEINKCFSINQQKVLSALPAPAKNLRG